MLDPLVRPLLRVIGPLLAAVVVVPVLIVVAWLASLLDLGPPDLDLPHVPLPSAHAPGWLRAVGEAIGAVVVTIAAVGKYVVVAIGVLLGVRRTRDVRRQRRAAEAVGRQELLRRLAVALSGVEDVARSRRAGRPPGAVGELSGAQRAAADEDVPGRP